MTKEELEKEAKEYADWFWGASPSMMKALAEAYIKGAEPREKRIEELEKENAELTQENEEMKKGLGCETCQIHLEYMSLNNRIDDLEKENAKLKKENKVLAQNLEDTEILNKTYEKRFNDLEKENAELKKQLEMSNKVYNDNLDYSHHIEEQLTNAKELLKQWLQTSKNNSCDNINIVADTEQFISEVEK